MEQTPKKKVEEKSNLEIIGEASGLNEGHFISKGEKAFNEITYRGIDWLLNSTTGVAFTYWSVRTHSGQKYFGDPVYKFFEKNLQSILHSPEALKEGAKWGVNFASIMVGGFISIPPIMTMEANKERIVRALDEKIYGKDVVDSDPKFAEAYKGISEEPPQNFTGGMITRFVSLAPLLYMTVRHPKPMDKYIYNPIGTTTKYVSEGIGIKPKGLVNRMLPNEDGTKMISDWDFIHNKIGFDFGLTFFYSYLHEYTFRAYAYLFDSPSKDKNVFTTQVKDELQEAKQEVKKDVPRVIAPPHAMPQTDEQMPSTEPLRTVSAHELSYNQPLESPPLQHTTGHA